ncbi:TrkA C-terminal domain-containing protein [Micromonospora sp. C28SCA-DRY-2]|uniref:cation:proton antiporter regulatory subunit n=1 Tax=Micromonospora sp. C28SCA-DRY-2 TaxID=3059522 RepID=UPI00267489F6|nr:TrkA C-terminal domain-containing protein [Micromonospora sp. C28SCA-DRY-2]MDO3705716.1 TrkA C-terminal domain-containing protein [Micromonospora sp. C28SCA-DRY-2]
MRIERTALPGLGVGYTLRTVEGAALGVLHLHGGRRDLVLYAPGDPDTVERSLTLTAAEARELAELLHPIATIDHVPELEQRAGELTVAAVPVTAASPYGGRALRDVLADVPGVTVVAVLRDGRTITAPGPAHRLAHGDALLVAGTPADVGALSRRITPGEP